MIVALRAAVPVPVDTTAIYSAVLAQLHTEYPATPFVLAETRSGVACMPHCGVAFRGASPGDSSTAQDHSPALMEQLRQAGLIDATCTVPERTFGCAGPAGHIFVALGEVQTSPPDGPPAVEGGYWVKVALLVPCARGCAPADSGDGAMPNGFGYWELVKQDDRGAWQVARRLPAFAL
jgi:hypothetical protein